MLSRSTFRCLSSGSGSGCANAVVGAVAAATPAKTATRRTAACLYYHSSSGAAQFRATPPEIPPQTPEGSTQSHRPQPQPHAQTQTTTTTSSSSSNSTRQDAAPQPRKRKQSNHQEQSPNQPTIPPSKLAQPPTFSSPLTLSPNLTTLLPQLSSQPPFYITAHIHAKAYLLTEGDTLRLPFLMPDVEAGDIIRLNRASVLGSRDYSLKGAPYLDERLFECRLRVMGTESEPLRIKEKTKRRRRHVKTVKSKHRYTILRVMEVKVKGVEELVEEGAKVSEEGS